MGWTSAGAGGGPWNGGGGATGAMYDGGAITMGCGCGGGGGGANDGANAGAEGADGTGADSTGADGGAGAGAASAGAAGVITNGSCCGASGDDSWPWGTGNVWTRVGPSRGGSCGGASGVVVLVAPGAPWLAPEALAAP